MATEGDGTVRFDGRVAIVTGAGNGLGREYAKALAQRGASVVVNDLGTDQFGKDSLGGDNPAHRLVDEILAAGGKAVACTESCATREGGAAIVEAALSSFGRLDVLIHNAGFLRNGPFEELSEEQIRGILDVHVMGCFYVGQPAFKLMKQQDYGRIVFISSSAGMFGSVWQSNYGAAKAGVVGLMNNLAREGAKHGVAVNSLLPSAFTRLGRSPNDFPPDFHDNTPEGWEAVFDPELSTGYVVPMAVWLASEQCTSTQQSYAASGGRFSRVFIGVTEGWLSDFRTQITPEAIGQHLSEIDNTERFSIPKSIQEELTDVLKARKSAVSRGILKALAGR